MKRIIAIFIMSIYLIIMGIQKKTGNITETWVKEKIIKLGLIVHKPIPDKGVDFVVTSSKNPNTNLKIQVKGRGEKQKNNRHRWFQIRTTPNQRKEIVSEGFPVFEAWRKKAAKAEIFIFVSEKHHEFWIFDSNDIEQLIQINRIKYGNWKDNIDGHQAEIDLDIEYNGVPLTEIFHKSLDNWDIIINHFL